MAKRESDIDDIIQHYPTPIDGHELGFYDAHSRDLPIDPRMEQEQQQQQQAADAPQEPRTPQQHDRQPSVSAEELQLAAQLSQGLAPMIEAQNGRGVHDLERQDDPAAAQNSNLNDADPSGQGHDGSIHSHDVTPHGGTPPQHPQHQPPHPYDETAQAHTGVQMAQLAQQAYMVDVSSLPPRKRSKVSRACDECRRKKVKCDAVAETPDVPCTNCRKALMECLFSRVPQKRGPSKGYVCSNCLWGLHS